MGEAASQAAEGMSAEEIEQALLTVAAATGADDFHGCRHGRWRQG
jgi:hypothetical protein